METVIFIPARYASTRYPGKPLAKLHGANGQAKTLIERSYEVAASLGNHSAIYVATDDQRISEEAKSFGAQVVMTPEACRNGTERCAAALDVLDFKPDIIVNLQGDAPLTPSWFLTDLIDAMKNDPSILVATPVLRCDRFSLEGFIEDRKNGRVGATTAVFNKHSDALYFSKEVVPFTNKTFKEDEEIPVFHHVGVYAYRPKALAEYAQWDEGPLEKLEGLEQLRFLENGVPVKCVEVESRGELFWELNNPSDVERIEQVLLSRGVE